MDTQTVSPRPTIPRGSPPEFPGFLRGKKILLCTESFGPVNGVSRTTMMLVSYLNEHGVEVVVVAPDNHTKQNTFIPTSPNPNSSSETTNPAQGSEVRLKGYQLPYNPELSIAWPVRLSALYRRTFSGPPDLIYLASPASLGFQVMLQLRQKPPEDQIPIICNFQTDLAGYCEILFPPPFSSLASLAFSKVQSFLFNHGSVKTIFYPSRFVRRYLEAQHIATDKLEILQRGVDTTLFNPSRRSQSLRASIAPNGEIILICVSRLSGEKGFGFLADAANELDARGLNFKLYIVGGNRSPSVEAEIHDLFAPLVESRKVIFAGFRMGEELATAYASADLFLHCSITETFGLVVLESMASGVPVVARDEGGPSDTVVHGKTGYLTPPGELDAFVQRVMELAGDDALRGRFAEDARVQAEGATWERINNQVAWRMAETIREREMERMGKVTVHDGQDLAGAVVFRSSVFGWLPGGDVILSRVLEDVRLMGSMVTVSASWLVVGTYLVFINAGLLVKRGWRGLFA
ncbi:hypothetical protein OQA88_9098 [Cercophora sp. LCS_1]